MTSISCLTPATPQFEFEWSMLCVYVDDSPFSTYKIKYEWIVNHFLDKKRSLIIPPGPYEKVYTFPNFIKLKATA